MWNRVQHQSIALKETGKYRKYLISKNCGYRVARRTMKAVITGVLTVGGVPYYQYIYGLMLNQGGTLSNDLPHCQFTFKAS